MIDFIWDEFWRDILYCSKLGYGYELSHRVNVVIITIVAPFTNMD